MSKMITIHDITGKNAESSFTQVLKQEAIMVVKLTRRQSVLVKIHPEMGTGEVLTQGLPHASALHLRSEKIQFRGLEGRVFSWA